MPWDKNTFRKKHNKGLTDAQAERAASVGNALLKEGKSDASAIKIANSVVKKPKKAKFSMRKGYTSHGSAI